jgi:glycosyltransferase involved in cell wall biosynthesis
MDLAVDQLRLWRTLVQIHQESAIDVLEGPELSLALLPRAVPGSKLIRMHGGHHFYAVTLGRRPRPARGWLEKRSFARADHLCAVSHFVAQATRDLLRLGNRPIEILPNPVDVSLFYPRGEEPECNGLILFVGSVCEKKGVRQLVQAMPQIVNAFPQARLWVVGRDLCDPQTGQSFTQRLRELIPSGLADRILFRGAVENAHLPLIVAKAQVCVYPSHMEAQGIVILEGMASGKAVVTSQTGPGPELIEDGVSGLLCDPHSPASIADKVIRLLKDASLRRRLGSQARLRVVQQFSTGALVERNEAFYSRCVPANSGGRGESKL